MCSGCALIFHEHKPLESPHPLTTSPHQGVVNHLHAFEMISRYQKAVGCIAVMTLLVTFLFTGLLSDRISQGSWITQLDFPNPSLVRSKTLDVILSMAIDRFGAYKNVTMKFKFRHPSMSSGHLNENLSSTQVSAQSETALENKIRKLYDTLTNVPTNGTATQAMILESELQLQSRNNPSNTNSVPHHEELQSTKRAAIDFPDCIEKPNMCKPAGNLVGFYNVFGGKHPELMQKIVSEQTAILESANVLDSVKSITYAVFGPMYSTFRMGTGKKYIRSNASGESGDERDTLELLHKHCQEQPNDRAFYIHTKGSFHPSKDNDLLRQNLMKAVVYCIQNETLDESDICGLRFAPIPYPHLSGNMWYARCSYISTLASPRAYGMRLLKVRKTPGCKDWMLGIRRAAQEHWATSHPSVVVKDILPYRTLGHAPITYRWSIFDVPNPASWEPDPRVFPRPGLTVDKFLIPYYLPNLECSKVSFREQQYAAVFGREETEGAAGDGFRNVWPAVALAAFNASRGPVPREALVFVADAQQHPSAWRASTQRTDLAS